MEDIDNSGDYPHEEHTCEDCEREERLACYRIMEGAWLCNECYKGRLDEYERPALWG